MDDVLTIRRAARASGFPPATLRYYEKIGLLPRASRTDAGYRIYDTATLDRLAFIARAKQLGCSLEEIAELLEAWEGGRCGPVQERLRRLVGEKIAAGRAQIDELTDVLDALGRAALGLEGHRPEGPCDARCGCVPTEDADPAGRVVRSVTMTVKDRSDKVGTGACSLDAASMPGRIRDWRALAVHVVSRSELVDGARFELDGSVPRPALVDLVSAEQTCCPHIAFAITFDRRGVGLEVRSSDGAIGRLDEWLGGTR